MEDLLISLILSFIMVVIIKATLFYYSKKQGDKGEDSGYTGKFTMELYALLTAIIYMVLRSPVLQ